MATSQEHDKSKDYPAAPAPHPREHDDQEAHIHRRKDELLDQGVEETFPASDPVAVKHIT